MERQGVIGAVQGFGRKGIATRARTRLRFWLLPVLAAVVLAPVASLAQTYPNQSIKFIVPYAPGGLPDTVARVVGQKLQERWGQSVVIENRPGGNGNAAAAALLSAPPDGYTFIVTDGAMLTVNPSLFKQLAYAPKDFAPVSLLARAPLFLAVHQKVPVSTLNEFVAYVRSNPGQVNYGSSGVGSIHHISMEALKLDLKLNMTHVPFRGTGQSVPALLGGHVETLFSAYPSLAGAVEGKTIKLLATNGAKRSPQADVPPISDIVPGFDFAVIVGIFARAETPQPIVQKLSAEMAAIVALPETQHQFTAVGIEPAPGSADEFGRAITSERDRVRRVIDEAQIKVE